MSNETKAEEIARHNPSGLKYQSMYRAAMEMAKWKDEQFHINDEEIRALEWTIAHFKSNWRIFSKVNAEGVAYLENLLKKLKNAQQ